MRVYNFSAGPSMLFEDVLKSAGEEILNYDNTGMSVMEMSHRGKPFMAIAKHTVELFREILSIPDNYKVLLLQGGASMQFEAVALNLLSKFNKADYVVSGNFAKKAYQFGSKYGDCAVAFDCKDKNYTYIPNVNELKFRDDIDYVHITSNNTIFGTQYKEFPKTDCPLVCDMSSDILSRKIDVSKFGLIYAGAQKNIGPAGLTIVIVREDLIGIQKEECPVMMSYKTQSDEDSLYNTPPTYSIYMAMKTLEHIKALGGISAIEKINEDKSKILYDFIDNSTFYTNKVEVGSRSCMNVPFTTPSADLDAKFVAEADKAGLVSLKGHRLVGGMRASIYNAMPVEGINALVAFMKKFQAENA